ncbi:MAG: hypothetical protein JXA89_00745 [Anaerolineae bacterium]|nr:hypothetical protein [Anaerolineae bacterium]
MKKREAAANVFMQQNVVQQELGEVKELDDLISDETSDQDQEYHTERAKARRSPQPPAPQPVFKTSEELQLEKEPIQVRETGFGIWKRIIVPPNAYVVHTRLGRKEPVTLGLGVSFRYNPYTDAYLVVPAAMQTIGIIANCISKEKQGINVLAYVQWQIDDFGVAYRKLDFSDAYDPLGIVNAQLREQAEAAIKDKIATMSVEEVLTDKEPVIEELTTRLKVVAEGRRQGHQETDEGLGIKIVTVQIKEAYVSSQRLWENLQAPFRYEKDQAARVSYLTSQDAIRKKELETRQEAETRQAETMVNIERIKQSKETEATQIRLTEEAARFTREQESEQSKIQLQERTTLTRRESEQRLAMQAAQAEQEARLAELQLAQQEQVEQVRLEAEAGARQKALQVEQAMKELDEEKRLAEARFQASQEQIDRDLALKTHQSEFDLAVQEHQDQLQGKTLQAELARKEQQTQVELQLQEATNQIKIALAEKEADIERLHQQVRNLINEGDLASRLVAQLPELAAHMPEIDKLQVLQTGDAAGAFDALPTFLAKILAIADSMGISLGKSPDAD